MKTARIYGKTINTWRSTDERGRDIVTQYEIAYSEYDEEGNLRRTGTEDFSPARLGKQTKYRWIFTWDGKKLNKGGHRWFDGHGPIRFAGDSGIVKAVIAKQLNSREHLIELRA